MVIKGGFMSEMSTFSCDTIMGGFCNLTREFFTWRKNSRSEMNKIVYLNSFIIPGIKVIYEIFHQ